MTKEATTAVPSTATGHVYRLMGRKECDGFICDTYGLSGKEIHADRKIEGDFHFAEVLHTPQGVMVLLHEAQQTHVIIPTTDAGADFINEARPTPEPDFIEE